MARIRRRDIIKVWLRSFYVQASFNYERMIGLGFCFCLIPIARRLFTDKQKQSEFLKRHLAFFNSHPYMATYALGATAKIEQEAILKKWDDMRPIDVFKKRVTGPLGVIGDTLFWQLFLPAMGLLGVVLLLLLKQWGAVVFLFLYNILHFYIRIRALIKSYWKGFDIISDLSLRGTRKYFQKLKYFFSFLVGLELIYILAKIFHLEYAWEGVIVFLVSLLISFLLVRRQKIPIDLIIIIIISCSIIVGLII